MCSIGEDDFGDEGGLHTMQPDAATSSSSADATSTPETLLCTVCNAADAHVAVHLPFRQPQCAACFLAHVRHKFRANLGANKMIPRGGRVLVWYDGAANSSALLDMIRFGTTMDRFKKLHIEPCVLYIDEYCLQSTSTSSASSSHLQQRMERLQTVRELLQQFELDAFYVSVAQARSDGCCPLDFSAVTAETIRAEALGAAEATFVRTVDAFATLTARQEYVHCIRKHIIRESANRLSCAFAFTAETCADLAVSLLANISLGRGTSVAEDVSFCDARDRVRILRPIRDFSTQEVAEYVRLAPVRCFSDADEDENAAAQRDEFASIQNLTRAFVDGLQADFQSTISTVFRTGSKIAAQSTSGKNKSGGQRRSDGAGDGDGNKRCVICASALDCDGSETLLAVEFSRMCALRSGIDDGDRSEETKTIDEQQTMCYGCRNVFMDIKNTDEKATAIDLLT